MPWFNGLESFVRRDEPLAMHTWFQLGGPAEFFAEPTSVDELATVVKRCRQDDVPVRVLGNGSNLLVSDDGVPGLVVHLVERAFNEIRVDGRTLCAGGGAKLGRAVTTAVHRGLAGLETLIGIPGTVGGALHGNAGTRSGDIGQWTASATVMTHTGEVVERRREDGDLVFAYRQSSLDELVILQGAFHLEPDDPSQLAKRMQNEWIVRKASQPTGFPSAGCIFKNPRGAAAGELIEGAGLRGTRIGGAVVSERHANFIVAEPECTAQDVLRLIELVRSQVRDRMGVELELEIEIW